MAGEEAPPKKTETGARVTPPKQPVVIPPKVFNCTSCGAPLKVTAQGQSLVVACGSCGSIVDANDEDHKILSQARKAQIKPQIPIGTRGKLRGHTWEVVGFMIREDMGSNFEWREYLLFNPKHGFRWLTEADGHWNYVLPLRTEPIKSGNEAISMSKTYRVFHRGRARVVYVLGEFYWRVSVGEIVAVTDYIRPPEVLSIEANRSETNHSISEYTEPGVIREAFGIKEHWPSPYGIAPNQPSLMQNTFGKVMSTAMVFLVVLFALQLLTAGGREKQVFQQVFTWDASSPKAAIVSEPIVLDGTRPRPLTVRLYSPVSQAWFSAVMVLFNPQTGKTFEFEQGVEYYSGYDGGESWSEGSRINDFTISSVEPGTYTLSIAPSDSLAKSGLIEYSVGAYWGGSIWGNFWFGILLIMTFPVFAMIFRFFREKRRWSQSDFAPFPYAQSEDDD